MQQALDITLDINVQLERREDGGLRAYSNQLPELTLSSKDCAALLSDIPKAIEIILREKYKTFVEINECSADNETASISSIERSAGQNHETRRYKVHAFAA